MPLRPCPDCKTEVSTNASACPKCGHRFVPLKALIVMLGIVGIASSVIGVLMFRNLAVLGVSPFEDLAQNDEIGRFLSFVRNMAYAVVIGGIVLTIGACIAWWRRKR